LGATDPLSSLPGTIRGDFGIDVGRNLCHGSDTVENAKREISLWFNDGSGLIEEEIENSFLSHDWISEN
jgi:nucleoside-diphosphate kinase